MRREQNWMIPEQSSMKTSHWLTLDIEQTETLTKQRQNALIIDWLLLIVDWVDFAAITHTYTYNFNLNLGQLSLASLRGR